MTHVLDFEKSHTRSTNRPTLVRRHENLILSIGKNKCGGVYLSKYDRDTRESEFVDLHKYYVLPQDTDRTYTHSLTPALVACWMFTHGSDKKTAHALVMKADMAMYEGLNLYLGPSPRPRLSTYV